MKAKPSLALGGSNPSQVAQVAQNIITAMTGNPNFGTPSPALADVQTKLTALTAKINAYEVAADAAKTALAERDAASEEVKVTLNALAAYVDLTSAGDEAMILSAGMPIRPAPTPVMVGQVLNLRLTASDESGEVFGQWDSQEGVRVHRVQISRDQNSPPTNWEDKLNTTKSKCTLNHDLVSGSKVWVRVKAIGPNNEGPWSDIAWKTVP